MKDQLGCEDQLETAARWLGEEDEFHHCPIKFVMPNTYDLLEKMDNYRGHLSTPPDYENQSSKFILGVRILENYIARFIAMKRGE